MAAGSKQLILERPAPLQHHPLAAPIAPRTPPGQELEAKWPPGQGTAFPGESDQGEQLGSPTKGLAGQGLGP